MHLLIPAAGMGRRMGSDRNKLLLKVLGQPLLTWTLNAAEAAREITWIGIVGQVTDQSEIEAMVAEVGITKPVKFIIGGATRQESVYKGLQGLPSAAKRVLIHDGARCLVTPQLLDRCATVLGDCRGLIAAIPVKDTIKVVNEKDIVHDTPDRSRLWAAQTPQGFDVQLLKECHEKGRRLGWEVTDDAALFERCQLTVRIVHGEDTNLKVTTPMDLAIAEFILRQRLEGLGTRE